MQQTGARYATVLTGDRELAADLVQDVLAKAYVRWSRIVRTEVPELYVKRMLTNEYLSWRRRWSTRHIHAAPASVLDSAADTIPDTAEASAQTAAVLAPLAGLPKRQRAVLVLRYYEGLSDEEIAQMLGTAPSTVRSNASRAIQSLRIALPAKEFS